MVKDKDYFWQIQGQASFCKAKSDWMQHERIHLSFVKHSGRNNGCKQLQAIEGALKLHGADGAIFLSELVLSGAAKKRAEKSRQNPGQNGFLQPIFTSIGGTTTSRAGDGKCIFRQFSLLPGQKSDYAMQMMTCEGEETGTGGIQPVKNAKRESIFVSLSSADLVDFAVAIRCEYQAWRAAQLISAPQVSSPSKEAAPTTEPPENVPSMLVIMYEHSGILNNGMPFATTLEAAPKLLGKLIRAVQKAPQGYKLDDGDSVNKAEQAIKTSTKGSIIIGFTGAKGAKTALVVMVDTIKI